MGRFSVEQYVEFAERALTELVRSECAVLWREAEAKISDQRWSSVPTPVNPHHLTTARAHLLARGWLQLSDPFDASNTQLLTPGDDHGRKDAVRTASRAKESASRPHGAMGTGYLEISSRHDRRGWRASRP